MKLKKGILFSDIHFGRKQNSEEHNKRCLEYIDFLCSGVKKHSADHVIFLGDWFEIRNSINVSTLDYGYQAASKLNDLNVPIYFIVGNHDMYTKHTRTPYSTVNYNAFGNFNVIHEITKVDIGSGSIICPYLFHEEYPEIIKYDVDNVYGHFEFNGFVVTGTNVTYNGGPNHNDYKKFKKIFSGHFHKRQTSGNVIFIGNTFCMDFSDANDNSRGFCIHDHTNDSISFVDWENNPQFINTTLSEIIGGKLDIKEGASIRCVADINMEYSKLMEVKNSLSETYSLKDIVISEPTMQYEHTEEVTQDFLSIDEAILSMLTNIEANNIDNKLLVKTYKQL
jgi:DNA repair exonuclease SbcCD nuclease subunit